MMIFALLFAWLPLTMAFMVNGPGGGDYVLSALLLLAFAVNILQTEYYLTEIRVRAGRTAAHQRRFRAAMDANDFDTAQECIRSEEMFIKRGAA